MRRQDRRGLVEHLGKKIFVYRLVPDFSGRELINLLRSDAYLSLETVLTCVTPERAGEFRSNSISIVFRRVSKNLFWGFHEKRTQYGTYNNAEPEKALLDWVYLRRQEGSTVPTGELDFQRLDRAKLLQYAVQFPVPMKQRVLEALANFNLAYPVAAAHSSLKR